MKIKLHHCADMGEWYTIIRAEHDGRVWFESVGPNASRYMSSERLSPEACIEGDREQMLEIAAAIQRRGEAHFKRVAVHFEADGAHFRSPKNSEHDGVVTLAEADELAAQILAELGTTAPKTAGEAMPRHQHDCDDCKPLGGLDEFDLYFCAQMGRPTVIARA